MRATRIIRAVGVSGLAFAGVFGTSTVSAFATAAVTIPAVQFTAIGGTFYPITDQNGVPQPLPSSGQGVDVVGCSDSAFAFLFSEPIGFNFLSGHAVIYRLSNGNPNGGNAEGTGALVEGPVTDPTVTSYVGHTHIWFGQNINPNYTGPGGNQQVYFGETASFSGTAPDGSTIQINGSGGGGSSASGNPTGWGHIKVTCSGAPSA